MRIALQQENSRSDKSRYNHRLLGVLLVGQGHSCYDVAALVGGHHTTIARWVHRFDERALTGLREEERQGRLRRLGNKFWAELEWDLRLRPRDPVYEQNLWKLNATPQNTMLHYLRRYI